MEPSKCPPWETLTFVWVSEIEFSVLGYKLPWWLSQEHKTLCILWLGVEKSFTHIGWTPCASFHWLSDSLCGGKVATVHITRLWLWVVFNVLCWSIILLTCLEWWAVWNICAQSHLLFPVCFCVLFCPGFCGSLCLEKIPSSFTGSQWIACTIFLLVSLWVAENLPQVLGTGAFPFLNEGLKPHVYFIPSAFPSFKVHSTCFK